VKEAVQEDARSQEGRYKGIREGQAIKRKGSREMGKEAGMEGGSWRQDGRDRG